MASRKRKTIGFRNEEELADAVNGIVNDRDSDTDNIPKFSSNEKSEPESANESDHERKISIPGPSRRETDVTPTTGFSKNDRQPRIPPFTGNPGVQFAVENEADLMRHRRYEDENEWACTNWFEYMLVVVLASLLLLASLTLSLFWAIYYRGGFKWTEDPKRQFNLHPVLMVAGFITFSGFSILLYRVCRCCRRIYVKLFHTIFHALAIPCIVVGFIAVLDSHNLNPTGAIPNFYSLHSWMGLVTMGLFAIQFIVGFFSFLILLCCEGATAAFRASLVPIHATFGITTFMLAVATCLTGLTEKAFFELGNDYSTMPEEGIVMNALAMVLVALGILLSYAVRRESFRSDVKTFVTERL